MVLRRPIHCPTRIFQGQAYDEALAALVGDRTWALITSAGWHARGLVETLTERMAPPAAVLYDIDANPDVPTVTRLAGDLPDVDTVIALGGGSVMDAAKGAIALKALGGDRNAFLAHLREGKPLPETLSPMRLIALPTTSGTGSEVTCWGTIWGEDRIKHSVTHPTLFPSDAILDPALCASMPRELTIVTALDALSHAMEAVWNRNHTDITDVLAERAIRLLHLNLDDTVADLSDVALRNSVQTAALLSGLAMGTTQTAAAHSISYPFTAYFGVPHGLACGFPLPEVARYNLGADPGRLLPIAQGLACAAEEIPDLLEGWFDRLGIGEILGRFVGADVIDTMEGNLITRARAANNLRSVDEESARRIARAALERFCPADAPPAAINS